MYHGRSEGDTVRDEHLQARIRGSDAGRLLPERAEVRWQPCRTRRHGGGQVATCETARDLRSLARARTTRRCAGALRRPGDWPTTTQAARACPVHQEALSVPRSNSWHRPPAGAARQLVAKPPVGPVHRGCHRKNLRQCLLMGPDHRAGQPAVVGGPVAGPATCTRAASGGFAHAPKHRRSEQSRTWRPARRRDGAFEHGLQRTSAAQVGGDQCVAALIRRLEGCRSRTVSPSERHGYIVVRRPPSNIGCNDISR